MISSEGQSLPPRWHLVNPSPSLQVNVVYGFPHLEIELLSLTPKLNFKYHRWKTEPFPFFILSKRVLWCGKCIFLAIYSNISYKICPTMKNVRILKFGNVLFKVHCILCRKIMVLLLERVSIEMITNKLCIFITQSNC